MIQIKIKRVYDDPEPGDGYRVLVDRLWPRGIKKACLSYDEWAKEITPSPGLRTWFHDDISRHWEEFTSMYKEELEHSQAVKDCLLYTSEYRRRISNDRIILPFFHLHLIYTKP